MELAFHSGLISERERGTYEQTLSLPTSPLEIVLGKLAPLVGICYVLVFAAMVETGIVFGIWPRGSLLSMAIVTPSWPELGRRRR